MSNQAMGPKPTYIQKRSENVKSLITYVSQNLISPNVEEEGSQDGGLL